MLVSKLFCVECGSEGKILSSLCQKCFGEKNSLVSVPDHFDLTLCPECGSWMKGKNWVGWTTLEDFLVLKFKEASTVSKNVESHTFEITNLEEDKRQMELEILFHLKIPPFVYDEPLGLKIIKRFHACDVCSRISGTYYEAILQVRSAGRALTDEEKAEIIARTEETVGLAAKKDRFSFISKMGAVHGGLDFYMSPTSLAKAISKTLTSRYGAQTSSASQLVGRKDGKDIHRTTFLVRIPEYGSGDFIHLDGTTYMVLGFSGKHVSLLALLDWKTVKKDPSKILAAHVFGGPKQRKEAVVISETDSEIQVLDPDTLTPVHLLKPEGFVGGKASVSVVKHEEDLLLCPEK